MNDTDWSTTVKDRDVCLVTGISGCGKTTFLQYLQGVPLRVFKPSELHLHNLNEARRLVDVSGGSQPLTDLQINHTGEPQNFSPTPVIIEDFNQLVFVECPSMSGKWSRAIRNENHAKIRSILNVAKSVKIILLMDYDTILVLHLDSVKEIMSNFITWFDDGEVALNKAAEQGAIWCVITKVPAQSIEEQTSVEDFNADLSRNSVPGEAALCGQLMVYDPLDRDSCLIQPVLKRQEILRRIQQGKGISSPNTVLANISFGEVIEEENHLAASIVSCVRRWWIFIIVIVFVGLVVGFSVKYALYAMDVTQTPAAANQSLSDKQ